MKKYFQAPWTLRQINSIIAITIILIVISLAIGKHYNFIDSFSGSNYRILFVLGIFISQWVLILAPLIIFTGIKYSNNLKNYGIKKVSIVKTIGHIISEYLKYIGIILILSSLVLYSNLKIPGFQAQENIIPLFGQDTLSLIIAGIIAIIIGPIVEEIFFRGFLLRSLVNKFGITIGSLITAAVFAVFHMQWQSIIPIFILGLIINGITIRKKSIIPSIAFHMLNNTIAFVISILLIKEVIPIENIVT